MKTCECCGHKTCNPDVIDYIEKFGMCPSCDAEYEDEE